MGEDRKAKHIEIDGAINSLQRVAHEVRELKERIQGPEPKSTAAPSEAKTPEAEIPTLGYFLDSAAARIANIAGDIEKTIEEIHSILF